MVHRDTQKEAEESKARLESNYPNANIVIKEHSRGGFLIAESRNCEECGKEFTTAAVGEVEIGGDYCRDCKVKVYDRRRQERVAESTARNANNQAYYDAEAWYYTEEG